MTNNRSRKPRIDLEWARLLGFDQARRTARHPADRPAADAGLQRIGAKVGAKPSPRVR